MVKEIAYEAVINGECKIVSYFRGCGMGISAFLNFLLRLAELFGSPGPSRIFPHKVYKRHIGWCIKRVVSNTPIGCGFVSALGRGIGPALGTCYAFTHSKYSDVRFIAFRCVSSIDAEMVADYDVVSIPTDDGHCRSL